MLWVKAFHLIFMVTWFAALFYLPRLFVYHAMSSDAISNTRFKVMERKLYFGIMTPGAVLTIIFGLWMLYDYGWALYADMGWLHLKMMIVVILVGYHLYCGQIVKAFKNDSNQRSHRFYRWFNELPVLLLVAVIILATVKPF